MKQKTGEFTGIMTFYFLFYSSEESHMSCRSWMTDRNGCSLSKNHQFLTGWRRDRSPPSAVPAVVVAELRLC